MSPELLQPLDNAAFLAILQALGECQSKLKYNPFG
jgi:hypothetical protein